MKQNSNDNSFSLSKLRSRFSNFVPRTMHKAICSKCGKDCEVPFKPVQGKPIFCRDCYQNKKTRY